MSNPLTESDDIAVEVPASESVDPARSAQDQARKERDAYHLARREEWIDAMKARAAERPRRVPTVYVSASPSRQGSPAWPSVMQSVRDRLPGEVRVQDWGAANPDGLPWNRWWVKYAPGIDLLVVVGERHGSHHWVGPNIVDEIETVETFGQPVLLWAQRGGTKRLAPVIDCSRVWRAKSRRPVLGFKPLRRNSRALRAAVAAMRGQA